MHNSFLWVFFSKVFFTEKRVCDLAGFYWVTHLFAVSSSVTQGQFNYCMIMSRKKKEKKGFKPLQTILNCVPISLIKIMCIRKRSDEWWRQNLLVKIEFVLKASDLLHLDYKPQLVVYYYKVALFVFKALNGLTPAYVLHMLHPFTSWRSLGSASQSLLTVQWSKFIVPLLWLN